MATGIQRDERNSEHLFGETRPSNGTQQHTESIHTLNAFLRLVFRVRQRILADAARRCHSSTALPRRFRWSLSRRVHPAFVDLVAVVSDVLIESILFSYNMCL